MLRTYQYGKLELTLTWPAPSPQTTFVANATSFKLHAVIEGHACLIQIDRSGSYYRYSLYHNSRAFFSRYFLVEGEQSKMLTLPESLEIKAQFVKSSAPVLLPDGVSALPLYLDQVSAHIDQKAEEMQGLLSVIYGDLEKAGLHRPQPIE